MAKVARLVRFEFVVRIVCDEKAKHKEVIDKCRPKMAEAVVNELEENFCYSYLDKEMPYSPEED